MPEPSKGVGKGIQQDAERYIDGAISGRAARVQCVEGIIRAFPDGRISRMRVFGAGDWGCCQFAFEGTNTGPLGNPDGSDTPPTGKRAALPYCVVARFEDDLIVEFDEYFDRLEMLGQLGLA